MNDLVLHVKKIYFDAIRNGSKQFEYRERKPYWDKRLQGREYRSVMICCGYPNAGDKKKIIRRRWKGCRETTIIHPLFGDKPVPVFAIDVSEEA